MFALTLITTLGCGLIAGVFFAFSTFVMQALRRLPTPQGVAAMQSINVVVLNPWFLGVFLGTAVLCAALAGWSLLRFSEPGAAYRLGGAALYLVGSLGVTMVCNVPRNERLGALDAAQVSADDWAVYVATWTKCNHVRALASLAAAAVLALALALAPVAPG